MIKTSSGAWYRIVPSTAINDVWSYERALNRIFFAHQPWAITNPILNGCKEKSSFQSIGLYRQIYRFCWFFPSRYWYSKVSSPWWVFSARSKWITNPLTKLIETPLRVSTGIQGRMAASCHPDSRTHPCIIYSIYIYTTSYIRIYIYVYIYIHMYIYIYTYI